MQPKKAYDSPKVTFYGNVKQITFGPDLGITDALLGAAGITSGGPGGNGECNNHPNIPGCSGS